MILKPILDFIFELIKFFYYEKIYKHKLSNKKETDLREYNKDLLTFKTNIYYPPDQSKGWEDLLQIKKWGCYFLSLIFLASLAKKIAKNKVLEYEREDIKLIFKGLKNNLIVKKNCFILDPQGILNELGVGSFYSFQEKKEKVKVYPDDFVLISQYDYKNFSHFVVCNSKMKVIFDSLGLSQVRSKGVAVSVRKFKILDTNLKKFINEI